jgi:DNA repair exonuclease SbcCD ATPase subunit
MNSNSWDDKQIHMECLKEAERALESAKDELENLRRKYIKAELMRIITEGDENGLSSEEETILDKEVRRDKIAGITSEIDFWENRLEKLKNCDYNSFQLYREMIELTFDPDLSEQVQEMKRPPGPEPRRRI